MLIRTILISAVTALPIVCSGQLAGFVIDAGNGNPVKGAVVSGEQAQTLTDDRGMFSIHNPSRGFLVITHLGYLTDTLYTTAGDSLVVYLQPDLFRLDQVLVRGPLLPHRIRNIPSSISYLTGADLQLSGKTTVPEALNRVSGVFVHTGSPNTQRVTIRGMGSRTPYGTNRIRAYYNDIPLSTGDGTTVLEDIDPSMIRSVEIVKGGKSAFYGAGLGGIILISGKTYLKTGLHGTAGFEEGMFGSRQPSVNLQYRKGKLSLHTGYAFSHTDGWRQNSGYRRHNLALGAELEHGRSSTKFLLHYIDLRASIPSSLSLYTYLNAPDSAAAGWLAAGGFEEYRKLLSGIHNNWKLLPWLEISTTGYLSLLDGYELRPFNILDDDALQAGIRSQMDIGKGNTSLRAGFEGTYENYNWTINDSDPGNFGGLLNRFRETRHPLRVFLQGGYELAGGGTIEAGLSYSHLRYRLYDRGGDSLDQSGTHTYPGIWSPFLGINFPLGEKINVYASAGHGYSPPSVEETLMPEGEINPDLKPESGLSLELGSRLSALEGDLYLDASLYLIMIRNLLVTKRLSEEIFFGANAGSSVHSGMELSGMLRLNKDTPNALPGMVLNIALTLSDNRFRDFTDDGIDRSGKRLPGLPLIVLNSGISMDFRKGFYLSYQYRYTGKQYLDDGNTGSLPPYWLSDVRTGFRYRNFKKSEAEIYLGIRNLFDMHYASMILVNAPSFGNSPPRYYYPGEPRYFYAGIGISF